jgi:hypothetical protein
MKKTEIAVSVAAILAVIGVNSSQAQADDVLPTKVTGGGIFQPYVYPSDEALGRFAISINPDKKAGKESPQAVAYLDGPVLRGVWGGPLVINADPELDLEQWPCWYHWDSLRPEDVKPAQAFPFIQEHPDHGWVVVWVFAHDNATPGYKPDDPNWSDWITVWIEPIASVDGNPFTGDELYVACGILVSGNIMDHRK